MGGYLYTSSTLSLISATVQLVSFTLLSLFDGQTPKLVIKVKRTSIYTNIHLETKEAAQMFREVHIVTEKKNTIPFLLTNSIIWHFGVAQRVNVKVAIISSLELNVNVQGSYTTIALEVPDGESLLWEVPLYIICA